MAENNANKANRPRAECRGSQRGRERKRKREQCIAVTDNARHGRLAINKKVFVPFIGCLRRPVHLQQYSKSRRLRESLVAGSRSIFEPHSSGNVSLDPSTRAPIIVMEFQKSRFLINPRSGELALGPRDPPIRCTWTSRQQPCQKYTYNVCKSSDRISIPEARPSLSGPAENEVTANSTQQIHTWFVATDSLLYIRDNSRTIDDV